MNNEKILALFEEISELKDKLDSAINSAIKLSDLNSDSKNITKIINRFNDLEELTNKKINDINSASTVFKKASYASIIGAFLIAIIIGGSIGLYSSQKAFTNFLQNDILKNETESIAIARIAMETEWQSINAAKIAKENGVEFFKDGIILPIPKELTNNNEKNKTVFMYKKK